MNILRGRLKIWYVTEVKLGSTILDRDVSVEYFGHFIIIIYFILYNELFICTQFGSNNIYLMFSYLIVGAFGCGKNSNE